MATFMKPNLHVLIIFQILMLMCWTNIEAVGGSCYGGPGAGSAIAARFRACPYDPPGLEVSKGLAGHCPVGEEAFGDCIADEDCFLKKLGNVCCYNRCAGITECHFFPK